MTPTESTLLDIYTSLLKKPLSVKDNIFDCGAHSLMVLQAIMKITEAFGQHIDFNTIYEYARISDLAAYLDTHAKEQTASRIRALNEHEKEAVNVFLLPSVLGTSSVFSNLTIAKGWNLWGLDYRSQNSAPEHSIEELAKAMHSEITSVDRSSRMILLGYSMGAYVAYEVAHLLKNEGKEVILILVDAHIDPNAERYIDSNQIDEVQKVPDHLKEELRILIKKYEPEEYDPLPIYALEARDNKVASEMQRWSERADSFSSSIY